MMKLHVIVTTFANLMKTLEFVFLGSRVQYKDDKKSELLSFWCFVSFFGGLFSINCGLLDTGNNIYICNEVYQIFLNFKFTSVVLWLKTLFFVPFIKSVFCAPI